MTGRIFLSIILCFLFLALTAMAHLKLNLLEQNKKLSISNQSQEVLLIPNGKALKAISFDYKNLLSNVLWFNTVSYFGKHYRSDQNYLWLTHMCNLVSDLDPKAKHVYEFCSLMLAWDANNPKAALSVLSRGIKKNPEYWRFYYLRGIYAAIFFQNNKLAKDDFQAGALLSDAPVFLTRLAAKATFQIDSSDMAVAFLKSMIARTEDPTEKSALEKHLKITLHSMKMQDLEQRLQDYVEQKHRYPENLTELLGPAENLKDPFGGSYYLDAQTGKIRSTSGVPKRKLSSTVLQSKGNE